ncbi:MAG: hypothetical protein U9Q81_21775 [Pseudomonadota bacterium]|nr:hypothetical protein [Pseudomonadota bacterium]
MNNPMICELARAVQHNCHISDARHGADYSLCVYLMKMREYFRWEKQLPYGAPLQKEQVGEWLQAREQLWEELEEAELLPIEIAGERFDPFDAEGINRRLEPYGLVYSGGLGNKAKPHFFLGDLEQTKRKGEYFVFVVASEHARDLTAPPAMTRGNSIFLRRESLRRMLWEKLESWRWSRADNALGRAFACYDFENALDESLDAMTDREIDAVLLHEQGEHEVGVRLGDDWNRMLMDLVYTPAELMARAVRDHLADCLTTLPALSEDGDEAPVHFYIGNLSNMRKEIFPGLRRAYVEWLSSGDTEALSAIAELGRDHWERIAQAMMDLHREGGPDQANRIQALVSDNYL